MSFNPFDQVNSETIVGAIGIAVAAGIGAIRWWFHVRRLSNADGTDGSVQTSMKFVLDTLRAEIMHFKQETQELRDRVDELEAENKKQEDEIQGLRKIISDAGLSAP